MRLGQLEKRVLVANLKGMIAARIKERATNETEEELKELINEVADRSAIGLTHLRAISTLPENDQGLLVSALIDTFARAKACLETPARAGIQEASP